jgi:hypothetical protein
MVTLAVMQALLGFVSETRWLRYARGHLRHLLPYLPGQSGYNMRVRKLAATMCWLIRMLACDTSLWGDDVWLVDSTPVECGRSKETVRRSDLADVYCAGPPGMVDAALLRARRFQRDQVPSAASISSASASSVLAFSFGPRGPRSVLRCAL